MHRTFQQTERSPAVTWGSLCEETWILRSVREWKLSSRRQCFLRHVRAAAQVMGETHWAYSASATERMVQGFWGEGVR